MQPPPADCDSVRFGCQVTIERDDGRRQTFRIVGEDEADPAEGTLSYVAPLARALIGKEVGDVVRRRERGGDVASRLIIVAPRCAAWNLNGARREFLAAFDQPPEI